MSRISWWRTDFGDEESRQIADSIAHEHISQGPVTAQFEQALAKALEIPHVVATTSGSMAMALALLAAGVGPGDEVIVPNRTWIATAHAPMLLGARPVLVDVEADRPIIDVARIEERITSRTRAIVPVHLNGRSAGMGEINRIARKHDLRVIEDAAQAFGSRNSHGLLGTQSDIGCFSLSVAKIIATGQGGFVATRDEKMYKRLLAVRTHGVTDVINASWTQFGFNFRFNDILASVGIVQLKKFDARREKVKAIYHRYESAMPDLPFLRFIPVDVGAGEIPIYIEVLCEERQRLVQFLAENDIETRPFYPDLDFAPYFHANGDFPNSRKFGAHGLFLPSGPAQPMENVDRVIRALRAYRDHITNRKDHGSR